MVRNKILVVVLIIGSIVVLGTMALLGESTREFQEFTGLCVYSSGSFSVLSDGETVVGVYTALEEGKVYRIRGRLFNSTSGLRMRLGRVESAEPSFHLDVIEGAYWPSDGHYLLAPGKIKLGIPIDVRKGELVRVEGIWYGKKFYPVRYETLGFSEKPEDRMPWSVEGIIIYAGSKTVLWNGSEEIVLYLPYRTKLELGKRVRVVGIVRFYSKLSLIVDSREDIQVIGDAGRRDVSHAEIGEVAVGSCTVIGSGSSLKLNCTDLRLYGFSARVGDRVYLEAIRRKSSLYCMNCKIVTPREELPNEICSFEVGEFAKVSGWVEWVKVYKNGFGLANITNGNCWVLLKLRKSLEVSLEENQTVTAYGIFTTYRGMPAFEIASGDDLCSGRC
ncbi:hypothetical protein [Thermococcus onnurineus]|uniref:hypothetical protein n=1 Tax=Thermococcus onnurineus TaxID=342948 RepID=UPI0003EA1C12|nr:hypothetical protein [Thermococcus onnurineus]